MGILVVKKDLGKNEEAGNILELECVNVHRKMG